MSKGNPESARRAAQPTQEIRERFLKINEVAQILQLHPRTVREYVRRGELRGRLIGGRWRFRRKDVDAFFDAAAPQWELRQESGRGG